MNPLILIGLDLLVSAVLILLGTYVVWCRVRAYLETHGNEEVYTAVTDETQDSREGMTAPAGDPPGEWEFGGITQKAKSLKRKGCSMEEIAQCLQLPTREVEMVLAISEMAKPARSSRGVSMPFRLRPEAARSA